MATRAPDNDISEVIASMPKNWAKPSDSSMMSSSMISSDLLLCEYVRLRKVASASRPKVPRTKTDKKLKNWKNGWVVITTKELSNCIFEYYKDEDRWLSKSVDKICICEQLKDIIDVKNSHSSYKCHVMTIILDTFSLLLEFKSKTTMESWIKQLNCIREYFLVQLIKSSNDTIKPGPYLVHVQSKKIVGYSAVGSQEFAWSWDSTDFYGYRLLKKIIPEIEIVIGTRSEANGNFHFIGPSLTLMCHTIMEKVAIRSDKPVTTVKKDGWYEDSWDVVDREEADCGKLQFNPSYGLLPHVEGVNEVKQISDVNEYEYIAVSPNLIPKKEPLTGKESALSNDYEIQYI